MIHRIASLCILSVLFAGARGADTYTIKVKKSSKGDVLLVSAEENEDTKVIVADGAGTVIQEQVNKETQVNKYREEILEKAAGKKATKLRRTYEKAQVTKDGKTTALAYEGKTVLIEQKDGKFRFQIEGGKELTGDEARVLAKEFERERQDEDKDFDAMVMPNKPVAEGETWKLDMKAIAEQMEKEAKMKCDGDKASGIGKLLKAYKKDGVQYGEMSFRLELPIKSIEEGAEKLALQPGATLIIQVTVDGCIDGTRSAGSNLFDFTMKGEGPFKAPDGKEYKLKLTVHNTGKKIEDEAKK